jgi:glycosyltransferase involved in cell wall biosynthesis
MKILHVMPTFIFDGGYLPAIIPLSRNLEALGHSVEIVAGENVKKDSFEGVRTFPLSMPISWNRSPLLDDWLESNIGRFDILHLHGLWDYPQFRAARYAVKKSISYLVTPHGIFMAPNRYSSMKKQIYLYLIGNQILNSAQAIHVTSNLELEGCRQAGIRKPLVKIPWGIDSPDFSAKQEPSYAENLWPIFTGRRILLFMSRLSAEKGLDQLLAAISSVKDQHKDILLVIAGEDDKKYRHKKALENMIEKNNIKQFVFFAGLVKGTAKLALLNRADIFVMPSYGENFSFAVAEALACGVPVVTTTKTPWQEIQDMSAGRYVVPEAGALRDAINELLSLPIDELREMGLRGKKLIDQRYDWLSISKQFAKLYGDICEKT